MLPLGLLREPASQKRRADIVIVTKAPRNITPMEKRLFEHDINILSHQHIYFTTIKYGNPVPVFSPNPEVGTIDFKSKDLSILLVSGIASPSLLVDEVKEAYRDVTTVSFPDHHNFSQSDINNILRQYNSIKNKDKVILTTEKDAARLASANYIDLLPEVWYYLPMEIEFLSHESDVFNNQILHYVNNNSRNSILYKK